MTDYFSKQADQYARFRPRYPMELYEVLQRLVFDHDCAWDVATGNGQAAMMLAERFKKVIATDISEAQLKNASPHRRITYKNEAAEKTSLADRSVDLITVAQAAHWFRFDEFYREVDRVLKPNGVIAIFGYGFFEPTPPQLITTAQAKLDAAIKEFSHVTLEKHWKPEAKLLWNQYKSIPFPSDLQLAPSFNMEITLNLEELLGYFSTWSAVQAYQDELKINPLDALKVKLRACWENPVERKHFTWKVAMKVGRKR